MLPLKYLNKCLRTIKNPLINCEMNLDLKWSINCVTVATNVASQVSTPSISDTKIDTPVLTLSIQDNTKFLEQSKSWLKRVINYNKFQSKMTKKTKSIFRLLNWASFTGVNWLFVVSLENETNAQVKKNIIFKL